MAGLRIRRSSPLGIGCALASLFMACLLLLLAQQASAMTVRPNDDDEVTGMMTLSPTSVEVDVVPGQVLDREMTIVNRTGKTLSVDFLTEDFEGSADPTVPAVLLGSADSTRGAKTWIRPEAGKLTVNQGETVVVNVQVQVPGDATPGGHYGIFLASFNTPMTGPDGAGMNVISRAGCYFLFRVAGEIDERGSLDPPYVDGLTFSGPVTIGLRFNNEGTIHVRPSGTVRIKNMLGMTVAEIPVNPWTILPDASRYTELTWDRELLFGRYSIEATIEYGSESKVLVSSGSFWGFSWIILLALLILLIIAALIFWLRRRRTRSGADDEAVDWEQLIEEGLKVANSMITAGEAEAARKMLQDLRSAAYRLGLDHEVVIIDDLLLSL